MKTIISAWNQVPVDQIYFIIRWNVAFIRRTQRTSELLFKLLPNGQIHFYLSVWCMLDSFLSVQKYSTGSTLSPCVQSETQMTVQMFYIWDIKNLGWIQAKFPWTEVVFVLFPASLRSLLLSWCVCADFVCVREVKWPKAAANLILKTHIFLFQCIFVEYLVHGIAAHLAVWDTLRVETICVLHKAFLES